MSQSPSATRVRGHYKLLVFRSRVDYECLLCGHTKQVLNLSDTPLSIEVVSGNFDTFMKQHEPNCPKVKRGDS